MLKLAFNSRGRVLPAQPVRARLGMELQMQLHLYALDLLKLCYYTVVSIYCVSVDCIYDRALIESKHTRNKKINP